MSNKLNHDREQYILNKLCLLQLKSFLSESNNDSTREQNILQKLNYLYRAEFLRAIDGDTIELLVDLGFYVKLKIRARLAYINTPEIHGRKAKKGTSEYEKGIEAKKFVEQWFRNHNNQCLICSHKQGNYGRWLAEIYSPDLTECLNLELIKYGLAKLYK